MLRDSIPTCLLGALIAGTSALGLGAADGSERRSVMESAKSGVSGRGKVPTVDQRTIATLATQVALDRAGFSPGPIDGSGGANTVKALAAYRRQVKGVEPATEPLSTYTITEDDAAGPFLEKIPADMTDKSKVPALAYSTMLEMLAERYHASPKLLLRLNPNAKWRQGETLTVPNVVPFIAPASKSVKPEDTTDTAKNEQPGAPRTVETATTENIVVVTGKTRTLTVQTAGGEVRFYAPVTTGSQKDPLPVGEWEVTGISFNPTFNYNPKLFWDANPKDAKAKIPAGPNNPVGVVWIDLNKPHYGIHGTPEPARVGYTESHGCIRLTNWDAMRVAALVAPGTKVILK